MRPALIIFCILVCITYFAPAQNDAAEAKAINKIAKKWSDAHNAKDVVGLKDLFDSRVLYYTQNLSREECLQHKRKLFLDKGQYFQVISGIHITAYEKNIYKCDFVKSSQIGGSRKESQLYLVLKKAYGKYYITGEGDKQRDAFVSYSLNLGKEIPFKNPVEIPGGSNITEKSMVGKIVLVLSLLVLLAVAGFWLYVRRNLKTS